MFTGIIDNTGEIIEIKKNGFGKTFTVKTINEIVKDINIGDSIAINGVCLTLIEKKINVIKFDVIKETLNCTNLNYARVGDFVNLERAMLVSSRLDGHILQGHVESIAILENKQKISDSILLSFVCNEDILRYCIYKGSIGINGISLTIAKINKNIITVAIIPHTAKITNIGNLEIGDKVNIETDLLAKYVENILNYSNDNRYLKYLKEEKK